MLDLVNLVRRSGTPHITLNADVVGRDVERRLLSCRGIQEVGHESPQDFIF